MSLIITPSTPQSVPPTLPICFEGIANLSLEQEALRYIDFPASGSGEGGGTFSYDSSFGTFKKTGGANGVFDTMYRQSQPLYALQPFSIIGANASFATPGGSINNHHVWFGVISNTGANFGWQLLKYCNANNTTCNATSGSNWLAEVIINNTLVATFIVNFNENFRLESDGINLIWSQQTAGVWVTRYVNQLPLTEQWWQFFGNIAYINNQIDFFRTYRGSFVGQAPVEWSAPLGGTLTGSGNRRCWSHGVNGAYNICISESFTNETLCVPITVEPLFFRPLNYNCNDCVLTGTVVEFESNAGLNGILTATGGTVIDPLTWLAPDIPGSYTVTYTLDATHIDCTFTVIAPLEILGVVDNQINDLVQGECRQLITNHDGGSYAVFWENLEGRFVNDTGLLCVPGAGASPCFGMLEGKIRARLGGVNFVSACPNITDLNIHQDVTIKVAPVFPTPEFCGPNILKWKRLVPEFKVIETEFEGGCDEVHLKSRVPTIFWEINYAGLRYEPFEPEDCGTGFKDLRDCNNVSPLGTPGGCTPEHWKFARRLDDFFNLVYGQYKRFTLFDQETGEIFQGVRFVNYDKDHVHRITNHSRTIRLVWRGCCTRSLMGGQCPVHKTTSVVSSGQVVWATQDELSFWITEDETSYWQTNNS